MHFPQMVLHQSASSILFSHRALHLPSDVRRAATIAAWSVWKARIFRAAIQKKSTHGNQGRFDDVTVLGGERQSEPTRRKACSSPLYLAALGLPARISP